MKYHHRLEQHFLPLDCTCKLKLHPISSTFSVLPPTATSLKIPHVATIVNNGVYYRPSHEYNMPQYHLKKGGNDSFETIAVNGTDSLNGIFIEAPFA